MSGIKELWRRCEEAHKELDEVKKDLRKSLEGTDKRHNVKQKSKEE